MRPLNLFSYRRMDKRGCLQRGCVRRSAFTHHGLLTAQWWMRVRLSTLRVPGLVPLALVTLIFLSACTVHQAPLEQVDEQSSAAVQQRWLEHQAQMESIDSWKVKGKIAVRAGSKGGHATLRWDRDGEDQHIELSGPLGGGRVVIDADAQGARLQDTRGGDLRGDSVSELVTQRLGWPLPFDSLSFWLRGLPVSKEAQIEWDEAGHVVRMNDSGWQLSYPEYQFLPMGEGKEVTLPRQLELNALPGTLRVYDKKGEFLGEDFFVRLIVKNWLP